MIPEACYLIANHLGVDAELTFVRALAQSVCRSLKIDPRPVLALLPYTILGLGALLTTGHALNVLQFGDDQAQQLGLPVERTRLLVIGAATLSTAAAVAFSGIIGFVGLVVPHILRMASGSDYRRLLPLSIICGASFLLVADVLARVVMAPQELPVGIVTALAGAPFFLWILRRAKALNFW